MHPDDAAVPREQQRRIAEGIDSELVVEYRWRVRSGEYRWFSDRRTLLRDVDGTPLFLIGVMRDISNERQRSNDETRIHQAYAHTLEEQVRRRTSELIASEWRYRVFAESTSDIVLELGQDGRVLWASPQVQNDLGWGPTELLDIPFLSLVEPTDRARALQVFEPLAGGLPFDDPSVRVDVRLRTKGGGFRWMAQRMAALRLDDGTLQSVVAGFTDIEALVSERTRAALQAELLRTVTDAALEAQVLLQAVRRNDGRIADLLYLDANRAACEYIGLPRERLLGRAVSEVASEGVVTSGLLERMELAMETGEPLVLDDYAIGTGLNGGHRFFDLLAHGVPGDRVSLSWRNVTERHRVAQELALSEGQLRRTAEQKDRFISALSHELRNPLASARLALWALQRKDDGDTALAMRVLERQLAQVSQLVDDLLDVTRIEQERIVLHLETVDLRSLLLSIAEDGLLPMRTKGVEFRLALPETSMPIRADRTRITQAFTNILHNATKFTDAGGVITLEALPDPENDVVRVAVRDTGLGMDAATIAAIFTPFGLAPRDDPARPLGLGLGLSIARQLVERHGGVVVASSEGPGRGSEFVVTLPLLPGLPDEAGAGAAQGTEAGSSDAAGAGDRDAAGAGGRDAARAEEVRRLRVLVIEDDAALGAMMAHVLRMLGHVPLSAASGPRGLVVAAREHPDVILCDIGMPGMDGYAVASALRADPRLRGIPRVALSGFASPQDVDAATAAGFDLHLAKPATPEALQAALAMCDTPDRGLTPP